MEGDHGVLHDVPHVDHLPILQYVRMFRLHEPSDVSEEKTSFRIVRIGVCFAELMVHPVITHPIEYRILLANKFLNQNYVHNRLLNTFLTVIPTVFFNCRNKKFPSSGAVASIRFSIN